jgi:hypothetical protein
MKAKRMTSNKPPTMAEVIKDPLLRMPLVPHEDDLKRYIVDYPKWLKTMKKEKVIKDINGEDAILSHDFLESSLDQIDKLKMIDASGLSKDDLQQYIDASYHIIGACLVFSAYFRELAEKATDWDRLKKIAERSMSFSGLARMAQDEFVRFRSKDVDLFFQNVQTLPKCSGKKNSISFDEVIGIIIPMNLIMDDIRSFDEATVLNLTQAEPSNKQHAVSSPSKKTRGFAINASLMSAEEWLLAEELFPRILTFEKKFEERLTFLLKLSELIDTAYNLILEQWRPLSSGSIPEYIIEQTQALVWWSGFFYLKAFAVYQDNFDHLAFKMLKNEAVGTSDASPTKNVKG